MDVMHHKTITLLGLFITVVAGPAAAKNTPDDWKWAPEFYKTFGEWTTACEHRSDDETMKRCYLRYVDVYQRDPFGAFFVFITTSDTGSPRFAFEYEAGATFSQHWRAIQDGDRKWHLDPALCGSGGECILIGETAETLESAIRDGADLHFALRSENGQSFDLLWPSEGFREAIDTLREQSRARGL